MVLVLAFCDGAGIKFEQTLTRCPTPFSSATLGSAQNPVLGDCRGDLVSDSWKHSEWDNHVYVRIQMRTDNYLTHTHTRLQEPGRAYNKENLGV